MSDSPWKSQRIFDAIQGQIGEHPELRGGMLNIDDSGTGLFVSAEGWGSETVFRAFWARWMSGRLAWLPAIITKSIWALVDAELFLPESWFEQEEKKKEWKRLYIPEEREFASKLEIGKTKIDHAD